MKDQLKLSLNDSEKEILALKAVWESIDSMVNHNILVLYHDDPHSEIQCKTDIHQKYFNIILLDFLNSKIFGIGKDCIESIEIILKNPSFSIDIRHFQKAIIEFKNWLDQNVRLERNGTERVFWFATLEKNIPLEITHSEFIKICGNISKHNTLGLNIQATILQKIFKRNGAEIELTKALLIMGEFFEKFHEDLFSYHISSISELLNNVRWGIYEYLQPLYKQSRRPRSDIAYDKNACLYEYPEHVTNSYVQARFSELMNDVRSKPYMPRFIVSENLKK